MTKIVSIERSLHKIYHGFYEALDKKYQFEIITSTQCKNAYKEDKFKVIGLESKTYINQYFGTYYVKLYQTLKRNNYDIIHCRCYYTLYALTALMYSLLNRKKIFFSEEQQSIPKGMFNAIFFYIYQLCLRIIINFKKCCIVAITPFTYSYLKKSKFKNVVNIELPFWEKDIGLIPHKQDKIRIICVARFEWLKAHFVLVNAINYLISNKKIKTHEITVSLFSSGSLEKEIKNLIYKYKLNHIFKFGGFVSQVQIYKEYKDHNLFVLPSRMEMIGAVVYEAMANSLPVIISDKVGSKYLVEENKNGFLFKTLNHVDLANKILILKDKRLRKEYSKKSHDIITKKYTLEDFTYKIENIINNYV